MDPAAARARQATLTAVVLLVAAVLAYLPGLGRQGFVGTEDFRARIAAEMEASGEAWRPTYYGRPILTKPPLHYWTVGAAQQAIGERSPLSARLPSLLALALTVAALGAAVAWLGGVRAGVLAGGLYLIAANTWKNGVNAEIDPLFACFCVAGVLFGGWIRRSTAAALLCGTAFGLAGLTKGWAALPFLVAVLVSAYRPLRATTPELRWQRVLAVLLPAAALFGCWPWMVAQAPEGSWEGAIRQDGGLAFGWKWSSLLDTLRFPVDALVAAFPASLVLLWRLRESAPVRTALESHLLRVLVLAFAVLLLPANKSTRYLLPLFPLAAAVAAMRLETCSGTPSFLRATSLAACALGVGVAALLVLHPAVGAAAAWPAAGLLAGGLVGVAVPRARQAWLLLFLAVPLRHGFASVYVPLWEHGGGGAASVAEALQEACRGTRRLAVARLETPRWIDPLVEAGGLPPAAPVAYFDRRRHLELALGAGLDADTVLWPERPDGRGPEGFRRVARVEAEDRVLEVWRKDP